MKSLFHNAFLKPNVTLSVLSGVLVLFFAFALTTQAVFASAPLMQEDPTPTPTIEFTPTETPTVTATPIVTATPEGTLPPPGVTGTPTVLVPVTGADLSQPGSGSAAVGIWIALWLVGLLLIGYGLYARLEKQ
jgi:hypothetical protein